MTDPHIRAVRAAAMPDDLRVTLDNAIDDARIRAARGEPDDDGNLLSPPLRSRFWTAICVILLGYVFAGIAVLWVLWP
jgi:hypothetical protein